MGLGMQIAYRGFAGSDDAERVAGVELVRLERAATDIANSHLTVEAYRDPSGARRYDARLDLITRAFDLIPVERGSDADVCIAIHRAFDNAMRLLEQRHVSSA
ncbi:hypothetical protein [Caballeronia sp. ATUFL_M2_KS44]|uniref:hypothetical protein n=1 Tax=Caballeronia sp. ATUFL_M2_KS44 TaxID=2921767 RepID=UPI00202776DC|nr:hypothetical protein [Caballeronia sp. ATUFL_M2_KS44]